MSALPTFRPTLDGQVAVPLDLLRDRSLTAADLKVALALTAGLGRAATTRITNARLETLTGVHVDSVRRSLRNLQTTGWIALDERTPRTITLRWRLPDAFADCVRPTMGFTRPVRAARGKGGGQ